MQITCYDRDGKEVKRVTSTYDGSTDCLGNHELYEMCDVRCMMEDGRRAGSRNATLPFMVYLGQI